MANFFSKPKNAAASTSKRTEPAAASQTDFDRTFKPFVVKKDATLAPVNWFKRKKENQRKPHPTPGVIVLSDDEDITTPSQPVAESPMDVDEPTPHLESMTIQGWNFVSVHYHSFTRSPSQHALKMLYKH